MPPQTFDPSKPFEAAPPFDPSKPFEPVAVGAHPEAKMSAAQPGLAWAGEADDQSVTLGDVLHDPVDAIARIGKNVGREVSDPKLWLSLVAGYFGPKAVDAVLPTVASAARATMRGGAAAAKSSPELVGIVSPRIGNAMKVARNVGQAVMQGEAPAEAPVEAPQPPVRQPSPREVTQAAREAYRAANPVPSAPSAAPPAETAALSPSLPQTAPAAAPAPAQAPPAAPAAAAPTSVPEAFKAAQAAFATAGETPRLAEVNNVAKLIQRGQPPEQALKVVVGNRPGAGAAAPAQPLSPVEDLAQRFNARQNVPSPLQRMQEELLQGGSAEAEFARKYAAQQPSIAQPVAGVEVPAPPPLADRVQSISDQILQDAKGKLAAMDLRPKMNGDVELETIAVAPGQGNAGAATKAMESLTDWADENGVRLILSPSEKGYQPIAGGPKTTSTGRLKDFYKRFGFVSPTGRNYDPTISSPTRPVMFRPPKGQP